MKVRQTKTESQTKTKSAQTFRLGLTAVLVQGSFLLAAPSANAVTYEYPSGADINQVQLQTLNDYATVCDSSNAIACDVPAGDYQLVVFSNGWADVSTREVTVSGASTPDKPASSNDILSNVAGTVYGADLIEINFDSLPTNFFPELRQNGQVLARNGAQSSSLIFRGADVSTGNYQLVVVSGVDLSESAPVELSISVEFDSRGVSVVDASNVSSPAINDLGTPANVQALVYGSDFIELQFDRLGDTVFPELRLNGVDVASNGVRSSSLSFRGADVVSGTYQLFAVSGVDFSESSPVAITIDLENRTASVDEVSDDTATTTDNDEAFADVVQDAAYNLAAYKADQLASVIPDLAAVVTQTAIGSPEALSNGQFTTTDVREGEVVTVTNRTQYQCAGGGTLIHETGSLAVRDVSYSNDRDANHYEFDQCAFDVTSGDVANGSYVATGSLKTFEGFVSASRGAVSSGFNEWGGFDLVAPGSLRYETQGSSEWEFISTSSWSYSSRQASFTQYRKTQGIDVVENMTDSEFQMDMSYHPVNYVNTLELQFSGSIDGSSTGGRLVSVESDELIFSGGTDVDEFVQQGSIRVQASDGASAVLSANGLSDSNNFDAVNPLVDQITTGADGNVQSSIDVELGDYRVNATGTTLP